MDAKAGNEAAFEAWPGKHADATAAVIVALGFLARLWAASGIFLNPDEALHFRLANQLSLAQAYRESLTASHPPLLTLLLYFWRYAGTSEIWLRLVSVLAGAAFCWMFYRWLKNAAGAAAAIIGLLLVAFLPPIVLLGAEIRQYSLLLAFLAGACYWLDAAFAKRSAGAMFAFSVCLYFAMLSHYSAFWFAGALGVYALVRFFRERQPVRVFASWGIGQAVALALAVFLYRTHISKLGVGESRTAAQGWMSEFFLRHSYFDPAHDNRFTFLAGHTFGVFQYFFGQLAVGDVMGLLFVAGIVVLLRRKADRDANKNGPDFSLGIFVILPFVIACAASLAHIYPYGGTRHIAFLVIPAIAAVSVALSRLCGEKILPGAAFAVLIILVCGAFGKPRRPYIDRADQSRKHMADAIAFVRQNTSRSSFIFTDYESELILGHYLCEEKSITFENSDPDFETFSCGARVVSAGYKAATVFTAENFVAQWPRIVQRLNLSPRTTVWVFQAGWDSDIGEQLQNRYPEFRGLLVQSFGNNIKLFKLTVGQPMPAAPH